MSFEKRLFRETADIITNRNILIKRAKDSTGQRLDGRELQYMSLYSFGMRANSRAIPCQIQADRQLLL